MTGSDPAHPADLARQFREAADQLMRGRIPGVGGTMPTPPVTLTAKQLKAVLDDVAARRREIQALREALGAFDGQLAALETGLAPLLAWTTAWADVEGAATRMWQPPPERDDHER